MDLELSARFVEQDYCRLCLSSIYELHKLFPTGSNESNLILLTKISLLAEIILIPSDELNARICSRCIQQLEDFDSFRRRCKDSDSQIRKIRTFCQQNDPPPMQHQSAVSDKVTSNNTQTEEQEQASNKFGGIFDAMQYCEDHAAPGEYRLLFDGCIYRKETLLVWRCQLPICPCQLVIDHDFSKFWIYGAHHHDKIPVISDQLSFSNIDRRICAFLNKLQDQIDGTSEKAQDVAQCGSSSGAQQSSSMEAQETVPSNPETTTIMYSTKGDKPSIFVNFHRYYKESVISGVIPSQIYWRCVDKNCLGMIITTADLRSFRLHKDHNHDPKPMDERFPILMEENFPVKVAALPMNQSRPTVSTMNPQTMPVTIAVASMSSPENVPQMAAVSRPILPENAPKSQKLKTKPAKPNVSAKPKPNEATVTAVSRPTLPENASKSQKLKVKPSVSAKPSEATATPVTLPIKNLSDITFYRDSIKLYYMRYKQFFFRRDIIYSSPSSSEMLWKCLVAECPGTMIVFRNLKIASGLAHNHGPIKGDPLHLTVVSPAEVLAKTPILTEISFFRCSTNQGICLLYQRCIYSVLSFIQAGGITWKCRHMGCDGQLRSGAQFAYLIPIKNHNHGPVLEQPVDVESYLPVQEALKELNEKGKPFKLSLSQLKDKIEMRVATELIRNSLKRRRKSTWC